MAKENKNMAQLAKETENEYFKDFNGELLILFQKRERLDEIFRAIENFVSKLAQEKDITSHQLRNIYASIKAIRSENLDDKNDKLGQLKMLRPNLAYIAGRQSTNEAKKFVSFIDDIIKNISDPDLVETFQEFMEAIVAYHKFHN